MPASDTALAWFFGRGVAKAFGFAWRVPPEHYAAFEQGRISRRVFEDGIRSALARFQEQRGLDPARLERFLDALSPDREHRFVTTNWNTLLDRELASRGHRVWHLNGSVENPRAPLLTEIDREGFHEPAFRALLGAEACVLAGLSMKSALDQRTLARLCAEQACPRRWIVVNPDASARPALPGEVAFREATFERWIEEGLPGL